MRVSARGIGGLCLAAALAVGAAADAFTIVDDDRSVSLSALYSCGITSCTIWRSASVTHDGVSPSFFAGREELGGYVFQTSGISVGGIFGLGLTQSPAAIDILEITGQSVLSITFELLEETPYALFGSLDISVEVDARDPIGSASVVLSDAGGALHSFSIVSSGVADSEAFLQSGVLPAGIYTLFAEAAQGVGADGITTRFEVHLALPEPSTGVLLAGLLLAPRVIRRARH